MLGFGSVAKKLFGSANERIIKSYQKRIDQINALEEEMIALSDDALKQRTQEFRKQLSEGAKLDDLLVPAFATVREAAKRAFNQRHYDVQLIGGMVLHEGQIAEMKTGEGKTLVATLAVYLNALSGKGVHVVTVNDYLAKRDAEWMAQVYGFLGLTTGIIIHGLSDDERRKAYACDVTYATNNELGFDYLRDNMKYSRKEMVQREHNFAIIDEVDSILIDEARTPLIISGPLEDHSALYTTIDQFIPLLDESDYELDEKQRSANFTESGTEKLEELLKEKEVLKEGSLFDSQNVTLVHHLNQALRAHKLFTKDKDYIVRNDEVVIIDEFTGRMMPGRRFSDGQHQALEAKERVSIQPENQTLASITFQNYFRMYDKLCGMTGTADTEAEEFADIYGLNVVEIPTNLPIARLDDDDEIYRTLEEKNRAIIQLIAECARKGQPILVGTTSIEKSETLSNLLGDKKFLKDLAKRLGDHTETIKKETNEKTNLLALKSFIEEAAKKKVPLPHKVLNARFHEQEAQIVAQAGVPGAVTIATNMAGRGTDIQLGGNLEMRIEEELGDMSEGEARKTAITKIKEDIEQLKQKALDAGGLCVVGTERHESRRIDNQLRGRSGRQGDPGHSKFYLSLQDDLMRIFGTDRMDSMLVKLGLKEGEAIVHPWINKALEKAQSKVEARNFDVRKNLLKYDDVMNDQRRVIFEQRVEIMAEEDLSETVADMRQSVIEDLVEQHIPEKAYPEQWDTKGLQEQVLKILNIDANIVEWSQEEGIADEEVRERLTKGGDEAHAARVARIGSDIMRQIEKGVILQAIDQLWREHLSTLDNLRSVIGFRGYGQRDPLQEYKTEAFTLFETMLSELREVVTGQLMRVEIVSEAPEMPKAPPLQQMQAQASHIDPLTGEDDMAAGVANPANKQQAPFDKNDPTTWGKVGRNELCPCGSGKKYKHCHGALK